MACVRSSRVVHINEGTKTANKILTFFSFYINAGAKEMYSNGLLATMDVNRLAKAHVRLWEGLGDKTAFGRYICFDTILSKDGAEKLAKDIGVQVEKICGSSSDSNANAETSTRNLKISDKKLFDLMSRTLRSCYHEN